MLRVWKRKNDGEGEASSGKSDKSDKSKYRKSCRARAPTRRHFGATPSPSSFSLTSSSFISSSFSFSPKPSPPLRLSALSTSAREQQQQQPRVPLGCVGGSAFSPCRRKQVPLEHGVAHEARSCDIVTCLRCKAPNCIVVAVAVHVRDRRRRRLYSPRASACTSSSFLSSVSYRRRASYRLHRRQ